MEFGLFDYATEHTMRPTELAAAAEERGFDYLFVPEHSHIPASRKSPWPGGDGLPEHYWSMLDPFLALTAAASVTRHLRLGTGVSLVIQRDPIQLAKEVATLDYLSHGRVMLGIGAGWNREEMEDHGTDYTTRFKRMRETVEACKAIWTEAEAEYHGDLIRFDKMWAKPKPVQKPHPPIVLGGEGPNTLRRVVRYADAWMPIDPGIAHLAPGRMSFEVQVEELQRLAKDAGRGPLPTYIFLARRDREALEHYRSLGVTGVVMALPPTGRDAALKRMDQIVALRETLR